MISATIVARSLGVLGVIGFMAAATTSSIAIQEPAPAPFFEAPEEPAPKDLPPPPIDAPPLPTEPEPLKVPPIAEPEPTAEPAPIKPAAATGEDEALNPLPPARELPPPTVISTPIRTKPRPEAVVEPTPVKVAEPASKPEPIEEPAAAPAPVRRLPAPPVDDEPAEVRRTSTAPDASPEDPDARARSFVDRNRKEAEEQLKALREEAAQLRDRLTRVEAGIRRWESLAEALNRTEERRTVVPTESVPRTTRGGIQYIVPGTAPNGVIIQSQPVTRADFVPAPLPR